MDVMVQAGDDCKGIVGKAIGNTEKHDG